MKAMNHSERLRLIVEDGHLDHSPLAMGDVRSIAERIRAEAARRDWSRSKTVARAIEIGLTQLEAQVALPFAEGAA